MTARASKSRSDPGSLPAPPKLPVARARRSDESANAPTARPPREGPISFRSITLRAALAERKGEGAATESLVAKRELERYYTALKDALASLRLEAAEARLIVDALNGSEWNASNYRYLAQEIADAIEAEDLDKKWGVQAKSLLTKLRRCGPAELLSIIDAVERFWNADEVMRDRPIDERLLAVGLLRPASRNGELRP